MQNCLIALIQSFEIMTSLLLNNKQPFIQMNRILALESHLISDKTINFSTLRNSSTVDSEQLIQLIYGRNYKWRLKTLNNIQKNPDWYEHYHLTEADRKQMRKQSGILLFKNQQLLGLSQQDYFKDPNKLSLACTAFVNYDAAFSIKFGVHWFLYMKTIYNLGTQKHQNLVKRAVQFQDVGCFGLTQILHGSNVRGILTEAHYDHSKKELVLNSPSKNAMKFWIGAAANVANMTVIWAQLYINDKCYGVHAIVVPLRDTKTHKLLPGVLVGDCGPKNGCGEIDNGFILLDKVRVPVDNLLNRISGIDQKGEFKSIVNSQQKRFGLQLGSLSGGRYMIAMNGSIIGLQSLTIAIRYASVRKQFAKTPNQQESLLIQYPLTKRRIMPLLAQTIVYLCGNMKALHQWDSNHKNILDPTNLVIQQLHAISSTTKPKTGVFTTQCIKQSRQMLGGHGYSSYSKLGTLYNDHDVNNTWQGDNNVLIQQTTKYILENAQKAIKGKKINSTLLQFLQNPPTQSQIKIQKQSIKCPMMFRKFLQYKLVQKVQQMVGKMMSMRNMENANQYQIWNSSQVFLGQTIAFTFGDLFYLQTFLNSLKTLKHEPTSKVLTIVLVLWILKCYRQDQFVNNQSHAMIQGQIQAYCDKLTPEALGLVEHLCANQKVIGSPFANIKGEGMDQYIKTFMNVPGNQQRPQWWKIVTTRQM